MNKSTFRIRSAVTALALLGSQAACFPVQNLNAAESQAEKNYAKALQYSMYFYDANMCGTEVGENTQYVWRDDCHVYDAKLPLDDVNTNMSASFIEKNRDILDPDGDGCLDVAGGYHDAGDHVKFGMPEGYSGAAVGWGYYEFRDAYEATGQDKHAETILRYFNDYYMKSTYLDEDGKAIAFCYQVGDGDIDHQYWNAPENDEMERRGWFATDELVSTDILSITSASLTMNYLNFKDTDPEYAEKSLKYAKALYEFAERAENKSVCPAEEGGKGYYTSTKWEDDYCYAAISLFHATKEEKYLNTVLELVDYYAPSCWTYCWNDTWAAVLTMLAQADDMYGKKVTIKSYDNEIHSTEWIEKYKELQGKTVFEEVDWWSQVAKLIDNWMTGNTPKLSPEGYSFLSQWGSARYNTATQFLALVYDKYHGDETSEYGKWAKGQMDYLLGENPLNRCYIVGFNETSARFPHHRASSGLSKCEDTDEQRYVLYGALVGGPDDKDNHVDVTADYIYNEVTIDYNAAFVGACAGLYHYFGDSSMQVTPDFPPPPVEKEEDPDDPSLQSPTGKYWCDAFSVDIVQDDGPRASEITLYVRTTAAKQSKNISVRYYFDTTGMNSISEKDLTLRKNYDQAEIEADHPAVLSGPVKYKDNIYYIEVSWEDYAIANSNKKYQFILGTYAWGNSWDPSDDWSHQDLVQFDDAFKGTPEKCEYICVYDNGVLVGGTEPDGTTPDSSAVIPSPSVKPTASAKPTASVKPTASAGPSENTEKALSGDVDLSGNVDVTDLSTLAVVLVDKKTLTGQAAKNADVNRDDAVTLSDLATLRQFISKVIDRF